MTEATPSQEPTTQAAEHAPESEAVGPTDQAPMPGSTEAPESDLAAGSTASVEVAATRGDRPARDAQRKRSTTPQRQGQQRQGQPGQGQQRQGQQRTVHPVLNTLYELYPQLFGARFLPLKLGVYQSLMEAHPDRLQPEDLKVALGLHTRSNRYLEAVASGLPRHDLQGQPVEPVAPEHVHHAIVELYRRKSNTPQEPAARARAVAQLTAAIQASGMGREAYRERFGAGGTDAMRAMLEEALGAVGETDAKREAMVRAFQSSGATVEAFAEMYGLDPRDVARFVEPAASA